MCAGVCVCGCCVTHPAQHKEPLPSSNGLKPEKAIPVTGPGVCGANQAPGTRSQATVFVVDTWRFSTHKDKEG